MSGDAGMNAPIDMRLQMTLICKEVRADGDFVIDMRVEDVQMNVGDRTMSGSEFGDFSGQMTLGPDGAVKDRKFEGLGAAGGQLEQMLNNPGFQAFVPWPTEGLRVGESLDLTKIMPQAAMEALMQNPMLGSDMKPKIQGEIVFVGVREIDGERAAELSTNLVVNLAGTMDKGGQSGKIDMGVRAQGTQFTSLETGFPLGKATVTMQLRGDIESGDQEMHMEMDSVLTMESKKL
jgi:hypothetical protein